MHSFAELIDHSTRFTLDSLQEMQNRVIQALQTSAATPLVKALQMIQLQKSIMAVGMFSLFESILQDRLDSANGFAEARDCLDQAGENELKCRFDDFAAAINVLKHGRGRSYDSLLGRAELLPFKIKRPEENFFCEGDVSEITTLIEVDDAFVMGCAEIIQDVSKAIIKSRPEVFI